MVLPQSFDQTSLPKQLLHGMAPSVRYLEGSKLLHLLTLIRCANSSIFFSCLLQIHNSCKSIIEMQTLCDDRSRNSGCNVLKVCSEIFQSNAQPRAVNGAHCVGQGYLITIRLPCYQLLICQNVTPKRPEHNASTTSVCRKSSASEKQWCSFHTVFLFRSLLSFLVRLFWKSQDSHQLNPTQWLRVAVVGQKVSALNG